MGRAGARRARVHLQRDRRQLPVSRAPSRATPRSPPGPGASRGRSSGFAEQLEFLDTLADAGARPGRAAGRAASRRPHAVRGAPRASPRTSTSTHTALGRHPLLGHGRPGPRAARATGASGPPTRSTRTSPWTAPPRPSPARAWCAWAATCPPARGDAGRRGGGASRPRASRVLAAPARGAVPLRLGTTTRACFCTPSTTGPTAGTTMPPGRAVPCGESSMWGDYHLREAALYVQRLLRARAATSRSSGKGGTMTIADLSHASRAAPTRRGGAREPGGGASPIQAQLLHGLRHPRAAGRPGAVAQPGAGGGLLRRGGHGRDVPRRGAARPSRPGRRRTSRPGCSTSSPTPGTTPLTMIYVLRARGRRGALAPGAGRHAAPRRASRRRRLPAGARPQCTEKPEHRRPRSIGIIMNGVTGRMGTNQHLLRSIVPIIAPGRRAGRRGHGDRARAAAGGQQRARSWRRWRSRRASAGGRTDLDAALADPAITVYFDAQTTLLRAPAVAKAIAAGKHVYCEKPTAVATKEAYRPVRARPERRREARRGAGQAVAARPA